MGSLTYTIKFFEWSKGKCRWIRARWGTLTSFVSSLVLSVLSTLVGLDAAKWKWLNTTPGGALTALLGVALFVGSILGLVASLKGAKSTEEQLAEAHDRLRVAYKELFNRQLYILSSALGFTDNERISVYRCQDDTFVMLARFSLSPKWTEPGRTAYPANEGLIARAWVNGSACQDDLPDPATKKAEYAELKPRSAGCQQKV